MLNSVGRRGFEGEALRAIAFPLGGIGTGTVSLGGRGNLQDWEILNHPAKGRDLPFTFFALWFQPAGEPAGARVMEGRIPPPYREAHGISPGRLGGLPRFRAARFAGEYPFAWLDLEDPAVPLRPRLRAWNPMIPMDADASGIPCALFDWRIQNPSNTAVDFAIAMNVMNPSGWDGAQPLDSRHAAFLGANRNEAREAGGLRGVQMSSDRLSPGEAAFGSLAISTTWTETQIRSQWRRGAWFDDLQAFWDDFRADGRLDAVEDAGPSPDGQTDVAALITHARLEPGESVEIPFALTWSFPNLFNTWNTESSVAGKALGNYYARRFPDAWTAAEFLARERAELERVSAAFHDALFTSTLPEAILDAASANLGAIRSTTCTRTGDGRFNAFEGCGDAAGCCPMNCTHVWNYAQSVAFLYPELERTVRETDFGHNTDAAGKMAFRTLLPLVEERWAYRPAADGQMGSILRLYREWRICGDMDFLMRLWPRAKAALEFAWSPANSDGWDADRDGVMEGIQHNTYDIEFVGPNTMCGAWYLAALRAGAAMADALGEHDAAEAYRALAQSGALGYGATWNGEYFDQTVAFNAETQAGRLTPHGGSAPVDEGEPRYQYGAGCLADQMAGQWFARCVGLGHVLPEDRVKSSLAAILRHNFRATLENHESCQRTYALNDEAGLLLCTWPRGGRPRFPFPYADEIWSGVEYHVAAHLIYEGFADEGVRLVKAARARFDGVHRNPWDECECGHHYARSLSSWSLVLAWSGYRYSAPEASIGFDPVAPGDFRCFFTAGEAWGVYERRGGRQWLRVLWGRLALRRWWGVAGEIAFNGAAIDARPQAGDLVLAHPVTLAAGDTLVLEGMPTAAQSGA
ncbi:MAG TPA: GH116 family glycosyl-hydrolase [Armatimonadota bacterium]